MEFPPAPLAIGDQPLRDWAKLKTKTGVIQILSPTQCVMDRLAGYIAWNDRQNLDQAVMVALRHKVDMKKIAEWAAGEKAADRYETFVERLKKARAARR